MHQLHNQTGITIALVKRPQDWRRIEQAQQYHLPIRHIVRIIQSPWIALYMPRWNTTHPYSIRHIAHMTSLTIMPRYAYLPDEPNHPRASDLYAILTFDAIYALRVPITSAYWRRVSIHHTTWGVLTRTYDLGALAQIQRHLRTTTFTHDDAELFDIFTPCLT